MASVRLSIGSRAASYYIATLIVRKLLCASVCRPTSTVVREYVAYRFVCLYPSLCMYVCLFVFVLLSSGVMARGEEAIVHPKLFAVEKSSQNLLLVLHFHKNYNKNWH